MTSVRRALDGLPAQVAGIDGAPDADAILAPSTFDEVGEALDTASEHHLRTLVWGGGTHQGYGGRLDPIVVLSTANLDKTVDFQPEDLTVTVEAGVRVADLESRLAEQGLTAALPEVPGDATVGGVIAAGISGWRRARYGPTRERLLEVTLVTGDGRLVRGGGRVVKNVTGFDLPRLATGSLGSLGVIVQVCLKLWPLPSARAMVKTDDGDGAVAATYRPQAIIEQDGASTVYLGGTPEEIEGQASAIGGDPVDGWIWPETLPGPVRWSLRVPPAHVREAVHRVRADYSYQAGLGVGEVRLGGSDAAVDELRRWSESVGGALVLAHGPIDLYSRVDPWGTPPQASTLQKRIVQRFDPVRILNPGRLPGGL
ncbi:MAG: FAD-binding oxidoreductase [Acidimicrobiia bacterium]